MCLFITVIALVIYLINVNEIIIIIKKISRCQHIMINNNIHSPMICKLRKLKLNLSLLSSLNITIATVMQSTCIIWPIRTKVFSLVRGNCMCETFEARCILRFVIFDSICLIFLPHTVYYLLNFIAVQIFYHDLYLFF